MCGLMGKTIGDTAAAADKMDKSTSKPEIKLYGNFENQKFSSGNYRLLYETGKWFFVFEPQGIAGSVIEVHAISKSKVKQYEVLIK